MLEQFYPYFQNKYLQALLIILLFLVVAKLITFISERYLKKWAKKTTTEVDDLIVQRIKPPFSYVMLFVGVKYALKPLALDGIWFAHLIDSIVIIAFVYIIAVILDILIEAWALEFAKKTASKLDESLLPLFQKVLKVVFFLIGGIWVLKEWNVEIGPFLASLGIAGFVIGFAMQDSLKNIFGGVSLILDKAYQVGDKIKLESGELGEVIEIGIRSTKIRTYDNEVITLPNGKMASAKIQNYVQPNLQARVVVDFGVAYGINIDEVKEVINKTLQSISDILDDPAPDTIFIEMGDSALKFQARFWVDDYRNAYDKKLEATDKIYKALNEAGIEIPFPTTTVYLRK